ncbi:MAG: MBL fold metallo-hydrolase [Spirochaetaceae bacterium]|nr:MBL fold metallo-hydrolase [Spirochaetaceae bacterium]
MEAVSGYTHRLPGGGSRGPATPRRLELTYFGRASVKLRTSSRNGVYIGPYAPEIFRAADLILVTHSHGSHNKTRLVARKPATVVIAPDGAVPDAGARTASEGDAFTIGPVTVRVMPASNKNHERASSVGYLVSFDAIAVYHAGDTDYLPEMDGYKTLGIDYALLPCDGYYNMGPAEAARCAAAMGAKKVVPIHSSKSGNFDAANAGSSAFASPIVMRPGESIPLEPSRR